jgi:hypothetical protein
MRLSYVYLQKKWEGCARNVWLTVDYEEKTYCKLITPFCNTISGVYELVRKSDIDDMINQLIKNGFTEE